MIKIDADCFEWETLNDVYDELAEQVKERIQKVIAQGEKRVTTRILTEWFYENDSLSDVMIKSFLLWRKPSEWIESYAKIVCRELWGNEAFFTAFLYYRHIAEQAVQIGDTEKRIDLITSLIMPEMIETEMFEIGGERALQPYDLEKPVKKGTLCSNVDRIRALRPTHYESIEQFMQDCHSIFDYDSFSDKYRDRILDSMNIAVCPYCNRQYITPYGASGKKKSTADVDHFYNKKQFPFLALSLFNFVPSCQICNSRFKLTRDFYAEPHVNPHLGGFEGKARFEIENIASVIDRATQPVIGINVLPGNEDIEHSVSTFFLEEVYKNHQDYAKEIILKTRIFNKTQIEEYLLNYQDLFSSREEVYRTIYGNYLEEKDQQKRPLSKLTKDLLADLGVEMTNE